MSVINWLHLSDLHFGYSDFTVDMFRKKLPEYIQDYFEENNINNEYIFVTGDIRYAKSKTDMNDYSEAKKFIYSIIKQPNVGVENTHLFVVPGNHDVSINKDRIDLINNIFKRKLYKPRKGVIPNEYLEVLKPTQLYQDFYSDICNREFSSNNMFYQLKDINILCLDTSLVSRKSSIDFGKLFVGTSLVSNEIRKSSKINKVIVLAHHGFDWLDPDEQKNLEALLKDNNVTIYLCGHNHQEFSNIIRTNIRPNSEIQCYGCPTHMDEDEEGVQNTSMGFFTGQYDTDTNSGFVVFHKWDIEYSDFITRKFPIGQENNSTDSLQNGISKKKLINLKTIVISFLCITLMSFIYISLHQVNKKVAPNDNGDTISGGGDVVIVDSIIGDNNIVNFYKWDASFHDKIISYNNSDYYIKLAISLWEKCDYTNTEIYLLKALEEQKVRLGEGHYETGQTKNLLGCLYTELARYDDAYKYFNEAEEVIPTVKGSESAEAAALYNNIGKLYSERAEFEKAKDYYQKAINLFANIEGSELDMVTGYSNIATICWLNAEYDKATQYLDEALNILGKKDLLNSSKAIAVYNNYAMMYKDKYDYVNSANCFEMAITVSESIYGVGNPNTARIYTNYSLLLILSGNYKLAKNYIDQALNIDVNALGNNNPDTAMAYLTLAEYYVINGTQNQALENFKLAESIYLNVFSDKYPGLATIYSGIGRMYLDQWNKEKAKVYFNKSLVIKQQIYGNNHPIVAMSYLDIGHYYLQEGDFDKSLFYYNECLEICEGVLGENHLDKALVYDSLASLYCYMYEEELTFDYGEKAIDIYEVVLGVNHKDTAIAYDNMAYYLFSLTGNVDDSFIYSKKAVEIFESISDKGMDMAVAYCTLGALYNSYGNNESALDFLLKGVAIKENVLGQYSNEAAYTYNSIGAVYEEMGEYNNAYLYYTKAEKVFNLTLENDDPLKDIVNENLNRVKDYTSP